MRSEALLTATEEVAEELAPGGAIEEGGVGGGLEGEDDADGQHDEGGYPHAFGAEGGLADGFLGNHADDIIEHEEAHRGHQGEPQAAFADDGAEGGSDEEKQQAGHREGELAVPLDMMTVDILALAVEGVGIQLGLVGGTLGQVAGVAVGTGTVVWGKL